jgi:hypothetical protein
MSYFSKHAQSPKRTQLCSKPYTAWLRAIFLTIEDFDKNIEGDTELNQRSFSPREVFISSAMNGAMPAIMWCITGELKRANVQIKKLVMGHVGKLVLFIFGDVRRDSGIQVR